MKTFREECNELAQLESFDPQAFQADTKVSQDLCNFMLTLALIFNDCKDLVYSYLAADQSCLEGRYGKNRFGGALSGFKLHIFRTVIGLLHELFNLIRKNEPILQQPFFRSVVRQINPSEREAWSTVVAVALGSTPTDVLGRSLLLVRNKMSFHYEGKPIYIGYSHHFLNAEHLDDRAYISRGHSMKETRFYFADAAALGYLRSIAGRENIDMLVSKIAGLLDPVNRSLVALVNSFIQRRGFPFRIETEELG